MNHSKVASEQARRDVAGAMRRSIVIALVGCASVCVGCASDAAPQPSADSEVAMQRVVDVDRVDWEHDCDDVYTVRPDEPVVVPPGTERTVALSLDAPWGSERVQAIAFKPVVDNKRILHHWTLKGARGELIRAWGPGDEGSVLPPDVGLELPRGGNSLRFAPHYITNTMKDDEQDRSGVTLCVVRGEHLRRKSAGVANDLRVYGPVMAPAKTLDHEATTECTVEADGPVTLWQVHPHAHRLARRVRFAVTKSDGEEAVLFEGKFAFGEEQTITLKQPVVVEDGDVIATTCVYDNPTARNVTFGEKADQEQCVNYATYSPQGALRCKTPVDDED